MTSRSSSREQARSTNPYLNDSIDAFLTHALRRNLPMTFVNHHAGPHAFDLEDDGESSRAVVLQILAFLESTLLPLFFFFFFFFYTLLRVRITSARVEMGREMGRRLR